MINIEELKEKAITKIKEATSLKELDDIKVNYLGKKGEITAIMQTFRDMAEEDRKKLGKIINDAKVSIDELIRERQKSFNTAILNEKLKMESIDVTLPSKIKRYEHEENSNIGAHDPFAGRMRQQSEIHD